MLETATVRRDPLFRFKPWKKKRCGAISRGLKLTLFGVKFGMAYHPIFDRCAGAKRKVIQVGLRLRRRDLALLYQRYEPGYSLYSHIDGPKHNHVLWLLLRRPKAGGELVIDGPHRSYLRGRIKLFDGGQQVHEVTSVQGSHRSVLMFQYCPRTVDSIGRPVLD
jgi:hypothetical protein